MIATIAGLVSSISSAHHLLRSMFWYSLPGASVQFPVADAELFADATPLHAEAVDPHWEDAASLAAIFHPHALGYEVVSLLQGPAEPPLQGPDEACPF